MVSGVTRCIGMYDLDGIRWEAEERLELYVVRLQDQTAAQGPEIDFPLEDSFLDLSSRVGDIGKAFEHCREVDGIVDMRKSLAIYQPGWPQLDQEEVHILA